MTNENSHRHNEGRNRLMKRVVAPVAGLLALTGGGLYLAHPPQPKQTEKVNIAELPKNGQKANVEVIIKGGGKGISNAIFSTAVAEGLSAYDTSVQRAVNRDSQEIAGVISPDSMTGEVDAGTKLDLKTDHPIIPKDLEIANNLDPNISIKPIG